MQHFLGAEAGGLLSSSTQYEFKQSHQREIWQNILVGEVDGNKIIEKLSGVFEGQRLFWRGSVCGTDAGGRGAQV